MKRNPLPYAVVGLALLFSTGCAPAPEQKLIGSWNGKFVLSENALQSQDDHPGIAALAAGGQAFAQSLIDNMSADFDFRADKTFTAAIPGMNTSGSWELVSAEGDVLKVRLHPENRAATEVSITFTGPDQFQATFDHGTVVFTKQPQ